MRSEHRPIYSAAQLRICAGKLSEAEHWFRHPREARTYLFGRKDAGLFALLAESDANVNADRAGRAWTERRWNLPRAGQLNFAGDWLALERSVVGLASMDRKENAAALRPLTEELVRTGVWVSRSLSPFRTAAGIAAACAGDWSAAEEHHLTAIHQMDTAPYRVSRPVAREWYVLMLLDRNAPGDHESARIAEKRWRCMSRWKYPSTRSGPAEGWRVCRGAPLDAK